jgi:hypothetical protein
LKRNELVLARFAFLLKTNPCFPCDQSLLKFLEFPASSLGNPCLKREKVLTGMPGH